MSDEYPQSKNKKITIIGLAVVVVLIVVAIIIYFSISKPTGPNAPESRTDQGQPSTETTNPSAQNPAAPAAPRVVMGALSLSTDQSSVNVNQEFDVQISVDTGSALINVAQAQVWFDSASLEVVEFVPNTSDFPIKAREILDDSSVYVIRGLTGKGYTGAGAVLATIRFKALAPGEHTITMDENESQLFLNDGRGNAVYPVLNPITVTVN